jgi:cytochrome d ubiquinol oxidase subunit II
MALIALALHGALYLAIKTERELQARARALAKSLSIALLALTIVSVPATTIVRPDTLGNYTVHPVLFVIPAIVLGALISILYFLRNQDDGKAFAGSCLYLAFMLTGAAVALYPRLLPSSVDPSRDITTQKALSGPHTLRVGLAWWGLGMCLALMYFVIVYRMFRGKVRPEDGGYGHG